MANSAAKKIHKSNQRRLRFLFGATLGINTIFGIYRGLFRGLTTLDQIMWVIFALFTAAPILFLWNTARAQWNPDTGALVQAGHDLSAPGLLEYIHDVIYIVLLTQFFCTFTIWGLAILIISFLFLGFQLASYFYGSLSNGSSDDVGSEEPGMDDLSSLSRKERRKAERKQLRQR